MTLLIIYLLIAIGVSFLCSILEAVLLSITPGFVESTRKKNPAGGKLLQDVKNNLDQSISSILILNTFAHTMGASGVGAQALKLFGERWETLVAFLLTLAILYLSEIIPKTLGAAYWRQLALPAARLIYWLIKLIYPFVWISTGLTALFKSGKKRQINREEIIAFAALGYREGTLDENETRMMENMLKLRDIKTEDILTPRSVVQAVDVDMTIAEALEFLGDAPFTRIPVYRGNIDQVTGMVLRRSLRDGVAKGDGDKNVGDFAKTLHRVSEDFSVLNLMDLFLQRREHMFLVGDEFGQTSGIVTLEDAVETLLGREIVDESDPVEDMQVLAREKFEDRKEHDESQ